MEGRRILVTGAGGLIGKPLVRRLLRGNARVRALDWNPGDSVDEDSPRRPFGTPCGDTKLAGELRVARLIGEARLPGVIVQPTIVYGPFDNMWTRKGMQLASRGLLALPGRGRGIFQPVYVDDLVEGLSLAATKGRPGETYLLPGPEVVTMHDFYGAIAAIVGSRRPLLVPKSIGLVFGRLAEVMAKLSRRPPLLNVEGIRLATMKSIYSGAKARHELGFAPRTTLIQGMARVGEWYGRYRESIFSSEERVLEDDAHGS